MDELRVHCCAGFLLSLACDSFYIIFLFLNFFPFLFKIIIFSFLFYLFSREDFSDLRFHTFTLTWALEA